MYEIKVTAQDMLTGLKKEMYLMPAYNSKGKAKRDARELTEALSDEQEAAPYIRYIIEVVKVKYG